MSKNTKTGVTIVKTADGAIVYLSDKALKSIAKDFVGVPGLVAKQVSATDHLIAGLVAEADALVGGQIEKHVEGVNEQHDK